MYGDWQRFYDGCARGGGGGCPGLWVWVWVWEWCACLSSHQKTSHEIPLQTPLLSLLSLLSDEAKAAIHAINKDKIQLPLPLWRGWVPFR